MPPTTIGFSAATASTGRASNDHLVRQVMSAMLQDHPFTSTTTPSPNFAGFTPDSVLSILASIPYYFFYLPRRVGRQRPTHRHRSSPPKPLPSNPALILGVAKALQFYSWVTTHCGFTHSEATCREMARVLARANHLPELWRFLRENESIVMTSTVTAVIKVLGEMGLSKQALAAFYRMKQLHCKPDVQAYNVVIAALCRSGNMKKVRFLLEQMELPGFPCPPDTYTYTILINAYCKRGMETGCRKAVRRRIWEANHMFRRMVFNGYVPDVVTYNCLIDGLCKTYRIDRALELFEDMVKRGCLPNRVTYNSFIRYYSVVNEVGRAVEMMRTMVERRHGVATSSSYTPIIHALCEGGHVKEAKGFLEEMVGGGSLPREFTYKLVCDSLAKAGEDALHDELCRRIKDELEARFRRRMQTKPFMMKRER